MLYSNRNLESEAREFDWGTIFQVALGEHGRGRRLLTLTCPEDTEIKSGINEEYSIGSTKSGKPRIIKKKDSELYMLLSSEGGYTRRGDGTIKVLVKDSENIDVLARGNGADGLAGRIGTWDCVLIHVRGNIETVVQVRTSGAGYGTPSDLYAIKGERVYHCTIENVEDCCEAIGMELPFQIIEGSFDKQEWLTL